MSAPSSPQTSPSLELGAFLGVFTPTVLTILGVILYMRLGWVVGNAGLVGTLLIVLVAHSITGITALSMSALSTNMRVGVGGAYYIISRSLGLELGGAMGIPLYLSQTLSVTLYAFGLAESLRIVWPGVPVQIVAAVIVIAVVLIAQRSTVLALKLQLPIMLFIAASLLSLVAGTGIELPTTRVPGEWIDGGFWTVFAVFFPAVTGVLAGVGLSGDLKDPSSAIPRGVLSAVMVGFVVYMIVPIVLASSASTEELRADPLIWTRLAWAGFLIMPGLWGAILSSAIGSVLGAPRTLQALATDRLAPAALGELDPDTGEPILALRITGIIALAAVALGDLNAVAAVVSMFFLTTYGMLNLAAGLEALVKDPSYRPRIQVPWWVSLLGAGGCFLAMAAINPGAFAAAVLIEIAIWWYLGRRTLRATWGDLRNGLWFALARFAMVQLKSARLDPRNWRPHILVFTTDLEHSVEQVAMASNFSQDHGIVTVTTLLVGDIEDHTQADELQYRNSALLEERGIPAFCEVVAVPDIESGIMTVAQANGFGGLNSNMVMFGWPGPDPVRVGVILGRVRRLASMAKSSMVVRRVIRPAPLKGRAKIVVWWKGRESNGDLMLLMAHLLSLSAPFKGSAVSLNTIADTPAQARALKLSFEELLPAIRIDAEINVIQRKPEEEVFDLIRTHSADASLVFLGLAQPAAAREQATARALISMLEGLPTTIMIRNAGPFRGRLV